LTENNQLITVYLDLLPNQPKNDESRNNFRKLLTDRFNQHLDEYVERIWEIPPIILQDPTQKEYVDLLVEARELYVKGLFYSCVAMCGIVGERLVKDALRASILIQRAEKPETPTSEAFDQFEQVEVSGIARFLGKAGVLTADATKAAKDLLEIRNQYAHARGKAAPKDAAKAISLVHKIVEDTVSVFKDFEIKDGVFTRK